MSVALAARSGPGCVPARVAGAALPAAAPAGSGLRMMPAAYAARSIAEPASAAPSTDSGARVSAAMKRRWNST